MEKPGQSGKLVTRRMFVLYTTTALAALPHLAGCAAAERSSNASQNDTRRSSDEPLSATDLSAPPHFITRIAVIGDTHVTASFAPGMNHTRAAFAALGQFDPAPSAIVYNGDITDHGLPEEYDLVASLAAEAGLSFPDSFVLAMGNHEQRGANGENTPETYRAHRKRFLERCKLERLYYDTEIAGQHIIVLGPDADPTGWWNVKLSDAQLTWLDNILAQDEAQGRRTFVFCHQPANDTVLYTYEGELAHDSLESSAKLLEVISKYRNAILFTGHSHSPADFQRPSTAGPLYVANSAVAYLRMNAHDSAGTDGYGQSRGLLVDVFSDRIEFISWDYVLAGPADTGSYTLA